MAPHQKKLLIMWVKMVDLRPATVFELVIKEIWSCIRKFIEDEGVFDESGKIMVLLN